mgnify:CR=1 FL=1
MDGHHLYHQKCIQCVPPTLDFSFFHPLFKTKKIVVIKYDDDNFFFVRRCFVSHLIEMLIKNFNFNLIKYCMNYAIKRIWNFQLKNEIFQKQIIQLKTRGKKLLGFFCFIVKVIANTLLSFFFKKKDLVF